MASKSLEEAVAGRLDCLSVSRPQDRDAFVNHMSILFQARIDDGHETLTAAVRRAAQELDMSGNNLVVTVLRHIEDERVRVSGSRHGDTVVRLAAKG